MDSKNDISKLREEYSKATLNRSSLQANPFRQFNHWLNNAYTYKVKEPNAMSICTVSKEGQPSLRMVLMRGFNEEGLVFYTNYNSKKGQEIEQNAKVAVLFFWADLQQQIRIEGNCSKVSKATSDEYFASRPLKSQAASKASPQSTTIKNRKVLENLYESEWKQAETENIVERPENWGGYLIKPNRFEFWQGRPSRLHDRFQYVLNNNEWIIDRLAP